MKILIYGFGRMGLTHYSILNSILENTEFYFVEPNWKVRFILKKNIKAKFFSSDDSFTHGFDLTVITAPPFTHKKILKKCLKRKDNLIFCEKPFGGHSHINSEIHKNVYIGYVLRFNPVVNWIKENINPESVISVDSKYLSSTIQKKPSGWRNSEFSGVLNEMGSHLIDLCNYLFDIRTYEIQQKEIKSIISDVDDEVSFSLASNNRNFNFYFNWVDFSVRKPIFDISINLKDGSFVNFDSQKVTINKNKSIKNISVVELAKNVPYYLRGIDFTKQMIDLTNDQKILCKSEDALVVNKIINQILRK